MTRIGLGAAATLLLPADQKYLFELDFWTGEGQALITLNPDASQGELPLRKLVTGIGAMLGEKDGSGPLHSFARISQDWPWKPIFDVGIKPYLTVEMASVPAVELVVKLYQNGQYGVKFPPVDSPVKFEPTCTVYELIVSYHRAKGGLDLRAKVAFQEQEQALGAGPEEPEKTEIVSYPFPVPSQGSGTFEVVYFGLGQRFGPRVDVHQGDPLKDMFTELEAAFRSNNPEVLLTRLVREYYDPSRGWFVAADVKMRGWQVMAVFSDPVLYGLRITANEGEFKGLLFEILYQKLGPSLGVFYGALTLPEKYRRVQLGVVSITLPGFKIWLYTNGDFKVSVGWPLGDNSVGLEVYIFTGACAFYFGRLRTGDHPDAGSRALARRAAAGMAGPAARSYNPVLVFGLAAWIGVGRSISAGPFSASLSLTVQGSFQGIIAWEEGKPGAGGLSSPPDYFWFAATVGVIGLLQGEVNLRVIRLSVLVRLSVMAGIAFETDYGTILNVTAHVSVRASLKIAFFRISVSFSATISETFVLIQPVIPNQYASLDGPKNPAFHGMNDWALAGLDRLGGRLAELAAAAVAGPQAPPAPAVPPAPAEPVTVNLSFLLQPGAVYGPSGGTAVGEATLTLTAPPPPSETPGRPGEPAVATTGRAVATTGRTAPTDLEVLVTAMSGWLLRQWSGGTGTWPGVVTALGQGGHVPGDWEPSLVRFLSDEVTFVIHGVDLTTAMAGPEQAEQGVAIFPMFSELQLTWTGAPRPTVFAETGQTYPNYLQVVDEYFAQLSLGSLTSNPEPRGADRYTAGRYTAGRYTVGRPPPASEPPSGPSLTRLMFSDYFLTLARQIAQAMAESGEPMPTPGISANAGGFVSRYLLGGGRLPDPATTPPQPPINLYDLRIDSGYALGGQQFPLGMSEPECAATLSLAGSDGWRISSIEFAGGAASATSKMPVQPVPPPPAPAWSGPDDRPGLGGAAVALTAIPPAHPSDLRYTQRTRLPWERPGAPGCYLTPLPEGLAGQLRHGPLDVVVRTEPEHAATDVTPALLITVRADLVRRPLTANVDLGSDGNGAGPSAADPYLPFTYRVEGADDETRDRAEALLHAPGGLAGAQVQVLYDSARTGYESSTPDPARPVLLAKTSLSTTNEPGEATALIRGAAAPAPDPLGPVWAPITDPAAFLQLVWEESVVHSGGFYLRYQTADGEGLPPRIFTPTAELTLLVTFPGAATFQRWHNAVQLSLPPDYNGTLYFGAARRGVPLRELQPSYPPGCAGFTATWTQNPLLRGEQGELYDDDWAELLYHLIQFRVAGPDDRAGTPDFRPSLWSLALSPSKESSSSAGTVAGMVAGTGRAGAAQPEAEDADAPVSYRQVVPAYPFVTDGEMPSGPQINPYAAVGGRPSLEFRLNDVFGNALGSDTYRAGFPVRYNDPLLPPAQWPGTRIAYRFLPAGVACGPGQDDGYPRVCLRLDFDPAAVLPGTLASRPVSGSADLTPEQRAAEQAEVILHQYLTAASQLTDTKTELALRTSVLPAHGGKIGDGAEIQRRLAEFVRQVCAELRKAVQPRPGDGPQPVSMPVPVRIDPAGLKDRDDNIFPIQLWLTLDRPPDLVYVDDQGQFVPGSATVTTEIAADLDDRPPAGPDAAPKVQVDQFARDFQAVFHGFDGLDDSTARVAVRTGTPDLTVGDTGQQPMLWGIRWSSTAGVRARFAEPKAAYFSLAPLSTAPLDGPAEVPSYQEDLSPVWSERTFTGVDLDSWAQEFLAAMDRILSPAAGCAIAALDGAAYADLMLAKSVLARALSLGLQPVFAGTPAGVIPGDLKVAADHFEQDLLRELSGGYAVSAVVQVPAEVTVAGAAGPGPVPPRCYGALTVEDAGRRGCASQAGATDLGGCTVTPARLAIRPTSPEQPGYLTFLVSASHPTEVRDLRLQLRYHIRFIEHQLKDSRESYGYVPAEWLRIALDEENDPLTLGLPPLAVPVPTRAYPPLPRLEEQVARQFQPAGRQASPIEPYLKWTYGADLALPDARSQDQLWVRVTYNPPAAPDGRATASDPLDGLFRALASFCTAWHPPQGADGVALEALVDLLPKAAAGSPDGPRHRALAIIAALSAQIKMVTRAWAALRHLPDPFPGEGPLPGRAGRPAAAPGVVSERFVLDFSDVWTRQVLRVLTQAPVADGRCREGAIGWPVINGQPHGPVTPLCPEDPVQPCAASPTPDPCWYQSEYSFTPAPAGQEQPIRLSWPGTDVLDRQSALGAAWRVRNAQLSADARARTNPDFVYQTPEVSFAGPVVPLIVVPPVVAPERQPPDLCRSLCAALAPLATAGTATAARRSVDVCVAYRFRLAAPPGQPAGLMSETSILQVTAVTLEPGEGCDGCGQGTVPGPGQPMTLGQLAQLLAVNCQAWYDTKRPGTEGAFLTVSAVLYAEQARLPVIQVTGIDLPVPRGWWPPT